MLITLGCPNVQGVRNAGTRGKAAPSTWLIHGTVSPIMIKLTKDVKRATISHDTLQPALNTLGALKQGVHNAGGRGLAALQAAPTTWLLHSTVSLIVAKLTKNIEHVQVSHDARQPALHTLGALRQGVGKFGEKGVAALQATLTIWLLHSTVSRIAPYLLIIMLDVRGTDAPTNAP